MTRERPTPTIWSPTPTGRTATGTPRRRSGTLASPTTWRWSSPPPLGCVPSAWSAKTGRVESTFRGRVRRLSDVEGCRPNDLIEAGTKEWTLYEQVAAYVRQHRSD